MKRNNYQWYDVRCNSDYNDMFANWIKEINFTHMLTIKHLRPMNDDACVVQLGMIIYNLNKIIFGRDFKSRNMSIKGFVSFEPDKYCTQNSFHNHLLLEYDSEIEKHDIWKIKDIFVKASCRLTDKHERKTFIHSEGEVVWNTDSVSGIETGCFHIIEKYSDKACDYIIKNVSDELTSIKPLGINGLSDNDLSFIRKKNGYKKNYYH